MILKIDFFLNQRLRIVFVHKPLPSIPRNITNISITDHKETHLYYFPFFRSKINILKMCYD